MPKIEVKQAIRIAIDYLESTYQGVEEVEDLRLEEVEFEEESNYWLITVSMLREAAEDEKSVYDEAKAGIWQSIIAAQKHLDRNSPIKAILKRVYRVVRIDAATGEVLSMKLREFVS